MNSVNFLIKTRIHMKAFPKTFRFYSSSDKDNKENKVKDENIKKKEKSEEALKKLNFLLQNMVQEDQVSAKTEKLNLAKPRDQRKLNKETEGEVRSEVSLEKKLTNAVKDVAQTINQDVKQTESELLLKLLDTVDSSSSSNNSKQASTKLSDVVKGMKIDRETKPSVEKSRAEQVRQILHRMQGSDVRKTREDRRPRRHAQSQGPEIVLENIDLFGSPGLGIFKNKEELQENNPNKTYNALLERDLKLAVTHPPTNYYQQMIQWTEQGKIWKFPINNEDQLGEELNVSFTEHIFLDQHLESWCPVKGPVRHFMELVCIGLSKNPYLTAQAKKEHIEWFKNYFEEKKKILIDTGAISQQTSKIEGGKHEKTVN